MSRAAAIAAGALAYVGIDFILMLMLGRREPPFPDWMLFALAGTALGAIFALTKPTRPLDALLAAASGLAILVWLGVVRHTWPLAGAISVAIAFATAWFLRAAPSLPSLAPAPLAMMSATGSALLVVAALINTTDPLVTAFLATTIGSFVAGFLTQYMTPTRFIWSCGTGVLGILLAIAISLPKSWPALYVALLVAGASGPFGAHLAYKLRDRDGGDAIAV